MKTYRATTYNTRLISYLSIAILVLNIGLANAAVSDGKKILLCTSQGYIWVSLTEIEADTDSSRLNSNTINIHKCPFCTFSPDDNNDIIQSFYGPKPYTLDNKYISTKHYQLPNNTLPYSSRQSRAPPIYIA